MVDPTSNALNAILPVLNRLPIPYVVIGGLASGILGRPRSTLDIDLMVGGGSKGLSKTAHAFERKGVLKDEVFLQLNPLLRGTVTRMSLGGVQIDLLCSRDRHDQATLRRRQKLRAFGTMVYLPTPEDLILLKMKTGRERDLSDCIGVYEAHRNTLNLSYLWRWAVRLRLIDEYHYVVASKK